MHALQEGRDGEGCWERGPGKLEGGVDWNASAFNGWHSNLYAIGLDLLDKANTS